jgi:hypothetical protein
MFLCKLQQLDVSFVAKDVLDALMSKAPVTGSSFLPLKPSIHANPE